MTRVSFLALPAVILIADQVTKALIRANMTLGQSIPPEGVFRLTYVTNPYGVFGFDGVLGLYLSPTFFMIATGIVVMLIIWLGCRYLTATSRLLRIGLGLVLGGAMGNLIDRIWFGAVTDFIDVQLWAGFPWPRWPTFNIADASLTTGIFILIICLPMIVKDT
ncbi:MAG: signal peptidase II [Dehalococcoidia bacterium]|nr:Lipoprotein signal peptidase [Chloroflexota bacterium]MBT9158887.1 Lipoprotein signal peptidase [Chloroflexota bacterium]MBT9161845.1 Lipoprotein signal peptidase [Chloroflexota bacterium]